MQFFAATFEQLTAYRELVRSQQEGVTPVSFTGVSQIHKAHLLTALCRENAPVLVVTAEEAEARRLCDDINAMLDETAAWMFPAKEVVLTPVEGITTAYEHARIAALTALRTGQCRVVAASIEALLQPTLSPEQLDESTILLRRDGTADLGELIRRLSACGYVRGESVSGQGQFSVRGDILDVFPVQLNAPVRIEFWDDTIDTMVHFDPETQRRTDAVDEVRIPPARETLCDPAALAEKIRKLGKSLRSRRADLAREKLYADADQLDAGMLPVHLDKYAPLLREKPSMLYDFGIGTGLLERIRRNRGEPAWTDGAVPGGLQAAAGRGQPLPWAGGLLSESHGGCRTAGQTLSGVSQQLFAGRRTRGISETAQRPGGAECALGR